MRKVGNLIWQDGAVPKLLVPAWVEWEWLIHGFSTRLGGKSQEPYASLNLGAHVDDQAEVVASNRILWAESLGVQHWGTVLMQQVHGAQVTSVVKAGPVVCSDGVCTRNKDLLLNVLVADCLPILMVDPVTRSVAAVHAGWRGTVAGIVQAAVRKMKCEYGVNTSDLHVAIGPGICGSCYVVDRPVINRVQSLQVADVAIAQRASPEQWYLDLVEVNRQLLLLEGVPDEYIYNSGLCTQEREDLFYSYRRDKGITGRLMGSIGLVAE